MKAKRFFVIGGLLAATLGFAVSKLAIRGETMSSAKVEEKWGNAPFQAEIFKEAPTEKRAKMAASLLKEKKKFLGLERTKVRELLGDYSGYYISGMYPTYLIQETGRNSEEAWQIVFLIDGDGLVRDIIVHKNCCYR